MHPDLGSLAWDKEARAKEEQARKQTNPREDVRKMEREKEEQEEELDELLELVGC